MAAALLTAIFASVVGLAAAIYLGLTATSNAMLSQHISIGIFSTMITLLAHSMMMFYLIGKGKAVKDAVAEGSLTGDYVPRISRLRAPVFSRATLAMALTMTTAIVGASVDVRVIPSWPHAAVAVAAIATQLYAFGSEIAALAGSARVVDEVNERLR